MIPILYKVASLRDNEYTSHNNSLESEKAEQKKVLKQLLSCCALLFCFGAGNTAYQAATSDASHDGATANEFGSTSNRITVLNIFRDCKPISCCNEDLNICHQVSSIFSCDKPCLPNCSMDSFFEHTFITACFEKVSHLNCCNSDDDLYSDSPTCFELPTQCASSSIENCGSCTHTLGTILFHTLTCCIFNENADGDCCDRCCG